MSIQDRVIDLSKKFPNIKVNNYYLRKIYTQNKIKRKAVRYTKLPSAK